LRQSIVEQSISFCTAEKQDLLAAFLKAILAEFTVEKTLNTES